MIELLLSTYRSVIALDCKEAIRVKLREGIPIIAADGAARWIQADYIVGDGDSHDNEKLIRISDQDTTDFEKCIGFAKEKDLLPALVVGVSGGEIDHILGNVQVLLKHARGQSLFFLDPYPEGLKIGIPIEKGTFQTIVKDEATVSILPFGSCTLSTQGLVWELKDQILTPEGLLAIRNRAREKEITFHVAEGKALVIIDL